MEWLNEYSEIVQNSIKENAFEKRPQSLYDPINYILTYGGKRLRPIMVLMGNDLFEGKLEEALKPSLGIEYFHNFTLMHDDIIDQAPLRRNVETVHLKYGLNAGILSGDALLIQSYRTFEDLEPTTYKRVMQIFSKTAEALCEGQEMDIIFEKQLDVSRDDYFSMIALKTGEMVGASFQIGAAIAGASEEDAQLLYEYGKHLGIAFQLKDDYLDVFGNLDKFGKKHAGDIYENKKTILYIHARDNANEQQLKELEFWYNMNSENVDKVYAVESIFKQLDSAGECIRLMKEYSDKAKEFINKIDVSEEKRKPFLELVDHLMQREV